MNHVRVRLFLAMFTLVALLAVPTLVGATDLEQQVRIPVSGTLYNPCNDEFVDVTGYIHYVFHITNNRTKLLLQTHANIQLHGTGQTTGTKYVDNEIVNDVYNLSDKGAGGLTYVLNQHFISQGSAPSFTARALIRFTFNANDELTAEVGKFEEEC